MRIERRHVVHRWCVRQLLLMLVTTAGCVTTAVAQQLMVDSVPLKLGERDAPVSQELRKKHSVQPFDGGWSIQPLEPNRLGPAMAVLTDRGRIQSVSLSWGPGFTPPAEDVAAQLAQALPAGARCTVRNVTRSQEGGTVRTLQWLCGTYKVGFVTGVYREGNTVAISLQRY